ncbi:TolC family outer membrane protein [Acidovorax cavernicola]|uniref:Channel protein TolC n=1 Tax=Acidovorax cavernicola TaxID=1675792 RepID=A0A9X8D0Z4_9BURK|nr:TolC family outer membrane protein [Acidovorax cavernicola]RIX75827.1 channel protein TolC [Acidovorax cavernicola]
MKKTALAFAAAVAAVAGLLGGPAWSLDLSQAYGEALEQDATIRSVRAATDARRERLPQARAQLLPNLSASVSRHRNWLDRTSPDGSGHLVTANLRYTSSSEALTLRQPLFRMYQMADYRQAQAQVDDAEAILERELQNVGVRVSGAYFEALLAEEHLALVLAQKTAYTTQLDAAQKRLGTGFGTRTDIDEARAALDLNVAQELEARQNLDFTRRQLQSLVNRPIDRLAPLDPSRMRLVRPAPDRVEDWIAQAELNSPELRSLAAQVEAARHELEKAQAGHYPTLDAIAQWSRNDSDTVTSIKTRYTNRSIGVQLNIPLYSGGYVSSTVRQALAGQQRAEETLEALRRDLGVRLHREFRGVTEGVLRVKALEQAARSAEQVVLSNQRSFEAGSRTLPDVLNAEHLKVSAQRDLAQARFVYLLSRIRLQALAGGAKADVIDEINGWLAH